MDGLRVWLRRVRTRVVELARMQGKTRGLSSSPPAKSFQTWARGLQDEGFLRRMRAGTANTNQPTADKRTPSDACGNKKKKCFAKRTRQRNNGCARKPTKTSFEQSRTTDNNQPISGLTRNDLRVEVEKNLVTVADCLQRLCTDTGVRRTAIGLATKNPPDGRTEGEASQKK